VPLGIVKAIGEVGYADDEGQLDDLPLIIKSAQVFERPAADGRSAARNPFGPQDGGFLFFIEKRAALEELQRRNLLVGDADSLRRSDVRARSILAAIDHRGLQVSEFLVAGIDGALANNFAVKRQELL
jgi:hypothetical protein